MPPASDLIALVCLTWYCFIVLVCTIGCIQLFRHYSRAPCEPVSSRLPKESAPHVTIIRPCKGREPYLYECLISSLQQDYHRDNLTISFCVASRDDPACAVIQRIIDAYSKYDVRLYVEDEDPALQAEVEGTYTLGPNPKIRNMSRAYREAKGNVTGNLIWILDCNIWVGRGVCGRMVDKITGKSQQGRERPYKFVHQLPVAVDVPVEGAFHDMPAESSRDGVAPSTHSTSINAIRLPAQFGGRLDEAFLSSAHAKMYVAINTVAVAPCICGKSSMFRQSHLNALTNEDHSTETRVGSGIDYFSANICEDHLIGDLLWKAKIPSSMPSAARTWRNHGLVYGDIALQPVSGMTVANYTARRVRWLRVRKFTVPVATLVEPGTESFLCSAIGACGLTKFSSTSVYVGSSWQAMLLLWILSICLWVMVDWMVYGLLQSGRTVETADPETELPPFARPISGTWLQSRRPFPTWLKAWLAREALTLPVWAWAIWGGVTVVWRDKKLWVGLDMKVHDMEEPKTEQLKPLLSNMANGLARADTGSSSRSDGAKVRQE